MFYSPVCSPSPADPSWDIGGEWFIPVFVPPLADPSWDVGGGVGGVVECLRI